MDELCAELPSEADQVGCRYRLTECCRRANECCRRQVERQLSKNARKLSESSADRSVSTEQDYDTPETPVDDSQRSSFGAAAMTTTGAYCPGTWDGFSCWGETPPDTTVRQSCPVYMERAITTQMSMKYCDANATWFTKGGFEWTDYTTCLDKESYVTGVYVCVAFNALSLVMLLPATAIFCFFRDLYRQDRVRLHVQFFLSLMLVSTVSIVWYMRVHFELLSNPVGTESVIYRNPVWCRVLSFAKIYLTGTNYFWMFCEGYHLHRLIANAFESPSSTLALYLIGWVAPALFAIAYAAVRGFILNTSCWTKNAGLYQWIIYVPNLVCLAMNLFFLCNILRTLLFQLHAHPHEPSNFRRGLKAGFMLIPLFGMQLLLTIYRPDIGSNDEQNFVYEYLTFAITNSQGIFVSLIFCFFNGEVLAHIKRSLPSFCRFGGKNMNQFSRPSLACTHMTVVGGGYQGACEDSPATGAAGASRRATLAGDANRNDREKSAITLSSGKGNGAVMTSSGGGNVSLLIDCGGTSQDDNGGITSGTDDRSEGSDKPLRPSGSWMKSTQPPTTKTGKRLPPGSSDDNDDEFYDDYCQLDGGSGDYDLKDGRYVASIPMVRLAGTSSGDNTSCGAGSETANSTPSMTGCGGHVTFACDVNRKSATSGKGYTPLIRSGSSDDGR